MKLSQEALRQSQQRVRSVVKKPTPLLYSERLSEIYGIDIYLKREDLTPVRSYKVRGAYNMMSQLTKDEKKKGVVTASAGNHAQGVALCCKKLGVKGTIFMPKNTPEQKIERTKDIGGEFISIHLVGDSFDEAKTNCQLFQKETGAVFIPPFDHEKIIEGQATVGAEIFSQIQDEVGDSVVTIMTPIGGGGLISGVIQARNALGKVANIIGVEPLGASSMKQALETGENISIDAIGDSFVDGACVKRVGDIPFEICKKEGIEIISCPEGRISTTMLELLNKDGVVSEPAGALSIDALKGLSEKTLQQIKESNGKIVCIVSGGNFDFERLPEVKERSLKHEGLKKYYSVDFAQRPGALEEYLGECIDKSLGDDIEFIHYRKRSPSERAPVVFAIRTKNKNRFSSIEARMKEFGFNYSDETNNPLVSIL